MTTLAPDSNVTSTLGLMVLLPPAVADRFDRAEMTHAGTAAALRVLATIHDPRWQAHVEICIIRWADMLDWARATYRERNSVRVRIEIAASLAGYGDAQPALGLAACVLDDANFAAMLDALRIARNGVTW